MVAEKCSAVACLAFGTGKNINTLDAIPIQKGTWAETLKGFGLLRIEKGRICFSTAWQHPEKPAGGWIFMQGSSPRNDWKEKPSAVLFICFCLYLRTCFVLNVVFFSHLSFVVTGCSVWSAIAAEILKKLQCRNLLNGKPQCGQKSPTKITIIWTSWLANILFKPYKNETNWIFCFFFPSACLLALQPTLTASPLCRLSFTLALPAEYTQLKCTKQLRVAQRSTKLWSTCCLMLTAVLETPHESLLSRQPLDGDMSPWHFLDPADFHCCFPVLSFFFVLFPTVLSLIIWANNLKNSPAAC